MANAVNIWNEATQEYVGLPILKGEKGDKGDSGYTPIKGVDYFDGEPGLPGQDAVTDSTYNPESDNAQSGKAVAEAINATQEIINAEATVRLEFADKITITMNSINRVGKICYMLIAFNVSANVSASYTSIIDVPYAPTSRVWLSNGTQFLINANSKNIMNNRVEIAKGNYILQAMFIINE